MLRTKFILLAIRVVMSIVALGIGIWYMSSSISGTSISYTSMDSFLTAIGVGSDIADANGCFLCGYISELFAVIGRATEMFWTKMVNHLWILMVIGFGIFLVIHSGQYIFNSMKKTADITDTSAPDMKLEPWFSKVWRQALRVMICGVLIGALGVGGNTVLRTVANITIRPVLYVGAELSMAASGVNTAAQCGAMADVDSKTDVLNPVMKPFMCAIGNLNTIVLAGAAGGFSLMNYAWMGMGGGMFTWVAGLGLIILFLIIGFRLFFQVLTIVFKLIFIIIFMPILIAGAAFEPVWKMSGNFVKNAISMMVRSAIEIVAVSLKIVIVYATVSYAADEYFPGPYDGFSAILPPMLTDEKNMDTQAQNVQMVFSECERVALVDGVVDGDRFKNCFTAHRATVERQYPGAFDFMDNGFEFLLLMMGIFFMYYYVVSPRIDKIIAGIGKDYDFGGWIKEFGVTIWNIPTKIYKSFTESKQ